MQPRSIARLLCSCLVLCTALGAFADEQRLGIYLMGSRIGGIRYSQVDDTYEGKPAKRSDDETNISAGMLGTSMKMSVTGRSWFTADGRPLAMHVVTESAGRKQTLDAVFEPTEAKVTVDNAGEVSHKTLEIPSDLPIVDDAVSLILGSGSKAAKFYVFDPTTISFVRNEVLMLGIKKTTVLGKPAEGAAVQIVDPRATMTAYVTPKGDLIKIDGPMGMEMVPETAEDAAKAAAGEPATIDLASASSIEVDKPIDDPQRTRQVSLRFSGVDLSTIPSDEAQTVKRDGESWIVSVHPPRLAETAGLTRPEAAKMAAKWTAPSDLMPADDPQMRKLAANIVRGEKRVEPATERIRNYVYGLMTPDAGIGVLRDAREVLKTHEGVCRDYAILTTTLLRAADIPARLCSGLVYAAGRFYYHAWAEAWDGKRWIGVDSTLPSDQMSAVHVKLAEGSLDHAFLFKVLQGAKIEVLSAQ